MKNFFGKAEIAKKMPLALCTGAFLLSAVILAATDKLAWNMIPLMIITGALVILPNFDIKTSRDIPQWVYRIGTVAFSALIANASMQMMQPVYFGVEFGGKRVLDYLLYCLVIGVITLFFSDWFWGLLTADVFLLIWSIANFYLMQFRSRPLFFADFFSIRTAAAVADGYNYMPSFRMLAVMLLFASAAAMTLITLRRCGLSRPSLRPVIRYTASGAVLAITIVSLALGIPTRIGLTDNVFSFSRNYMYSFFTAISAAHTTPPKGYSPDDIAGGIVLDYPSDSADSIDLADAPNVIVIMNEAFSDLSVVGEFNTNIEVMPFINSLSENTIRGYTYSSVFGGNTANSEYEFLTGDTMAFIPNGFMPYTTYIRGEYPTVVQSFGDMGYTTLAMHPAMSGNWNRTLIYDYFGFQKTMFIEDFSDIKILRTRTSDRCDYENLIAQFEAKSEEEKLFVFNITMQNHSNYSGIYENFPQEVYLTDYPGKYPDAEQYLSLIHESDKAVQELVEYFSTVDEHTIICFFGDHQPGVGDAFYQALYGKPFAELSQEELQRRYISPFFIWANYDIEEREDVCTSLNYLSPILFDAAGLPMTGYQKMLLELSGEYPVISAIGTIDAEGKHYEHGADIESELLGSYRMAQYNHLFDKKHRCDELFKLNQNGE